MLTVHRASSGEALAQALAGVLAGPPGDPFTREIVAVPAKGVERWLAQRLSHTLGAVTGDGVCANVDFPWPSTVLDEAVQSALQAARPEDAAAVQRWAPQRMLWPLLEVTDENLSQPWLRTLAHHLGSWDADSTRSTDKGRRVATLTKLARLYDDYGQARPEMLAAWAAGRDETGDGAALPADLRWQAELWRRVRARIGPCPAELLDDACQHLIDQPGATSLPARLSVFGASRLAPAQLRVLAALAQHREVHLWLHHPSPALWDLTAGQAGTGGQGGPGGQEAQTGPEQAVTVRRVDDMVRTSLRNPLLASMSRDLLELQLLLGRHAPGAADVQHRSGPRPGTLLGQLQDDLATDAGSARPDRVLVAADRTVQVHSCHGRTRQVEVLREVVLGLLRDDPTLEPRDILVMCPDVEAFAPLVAAAFSLGAEDGEGHPAARLRVRLADRSLQQTNALLDVLSQILSLGTARISAPEVLDLAGLSAVRRRFGIDKDALERLREWVAGAGVRWGLDAPHRAEWQLSGISQGTWRSGLDRLMLGVAMEGEGTIVSDVVPMGDVDSSDIELAGRLAELVDRLDAAQALMSGRHTVAEWMTGLEDATLGLADSGTANAWQQTQLRGVLADALDDAGDSGCELGLADVRSLLTGMLAGRPSRSSFRTGTLTVCTLVPMRSVPHRVICLLGLDDGTFPRQSIRDGDDVLARDPWVGERDPRSEDRQLLLDAVCAAGEHLVITYSGADERTGASIPPAVPLGELLDALDRTASPGGPAGQRVRDVITTQHPLQPFDARNFTGGHLGVPGPFSFDRAGLEGAIAARGARTTPGAFLPVQLRPLAAATIELADLTRLLLHPAKGFLRQRLDVAVARADEDPDDTLPVEFDGLESWSLGDRLLSRRLADISPLDCIRLEQLGGLLPPGPLGNELLRKVGREVDTVVRASATERRVPAQSHDIDVQLPDGTRLVGTVRDVREDVLLSVTYSKVSAKQRLSAWINLVALAATDDSRSWSAVVVGRDPGRGQTGAICRILGPIGADDARQTLAELAGLYRAGLRSPLPIPLKSAAAYAAPRARGSRVVASRTAASNEWRSDRFDKEDADEENVLVYGRGAPFSVLTQEPPQPGEAAWFPDEEDRFGVLSRRLWNRLLAAEREDRR